MYIIRAFTFPTENLKDVVSQPMIAWICGSFKARSFPKYFTTFPIFMYFWRIYENKEGPETTRNQLKPTETIQKVPETTWNHPKSTIS